MVLSGSIKQPIMAVLVYVSDVQAGLAWYQLAFRPLFARICQNLTLSSWMLVEL